MTDKTSESIEVRGEDVEEERERFEANLAGRRLVARLRAGAKARGLPAPERASDYELAMLLDLLPQALRDDARTQAARNPHHNAEDLLICLVRLVIEAEAERLQWN